MPAPPGPQSCSKPCSSGLTAGPRPRLHRPASAAQVSPQKARPPASAPTRRVREAAPAQTRGGPMSIQGFIKATGHAAPGDAGGAPEPKRAKRNGRRGAADFFD